MTEEEILFRGFSDQERSDFLSLGEEREFGPDEALVTESAPGSSLFIVRRGTVSVEKDGVGLATMHDGDILGELVIFRPGARSATVRSLSATTVLEFDKDVITDFFKRREERLFKIFVINVINILSLKLDRTDERIVQLESLLTRG